jgi:hypothetical protein
MRLCSAYDMVVPGHGKGISKTDIAMAIPPGYYGRVGEREPAPHASCCAPPGHALSPAPAQPRALVLPGRTTSTSALA